jgi:hypothetical protein
MTDTSNASASQPRAGETIAEDRVRRTVEDALELAGYAVSTGFKGPDGQPLAFDDIATIQMAGAQIGLIDIPVTGAPALSIDQWNRFEQAYYRLAMVLSPVTAETLRDTRDTARPRGKYASFWWRLRDFFLGYSPAQRFTRELWAWAIVFAVFIVAAEWGINVLGLKKETAAGGWRTLLQSLVPWAYGGLGACAYMLRSAHYFIYQRSFDTRRTPEYFNRILLGAISGGAIILFAEYLLSAEDSSAGHLGSAALGFVAGYSGDLLFNTIERIVGAIFPKVQVEQTATDDAKKKAAASKPVPPGPPGGPPDQKSSAAPVKTPTGVTPAAPAGGKPDAPASTAPGR